MDRYKAIAERLTDRAYANLGRPFIGNEREIAVAELSQEIKNHFEPLSSEVEVKREPERCPICDWTMAASVSEGCVPGNCSYRPHPGTAEYFRIQERRAKLKSDTVPTEAAKPPEDTPLTYKIEDGQIVIRIGIGTNAFAFEESLYNNPFVVSANDFKRTHKVIDPLEFAKDVIHAMQDEEEDGSSPLSDFLDEMAIAAVEDGSIAVEETVKND